MNVSDKIMEMYEAGELSKEAVFKLALFKANLEKQASLGKGMMLGLGIAGGELLLNKAMDKYETHKATWETEESFRRMLNANPELMSKDLQQVREFFDTLAKFAPTLAADPRAAGTYLKRVIDFDPTGGADYMTIQNLVKLEKDHQAAISAKRDIQTGWTGGTAKQVLPLLKD